LVSQDSPKLLAETLLWCLSQPHESLPKRHQSSPKSSLFWFVKIHILKLWTNPNIFNLLNLSTINVISFGFHEIYQAYSTKWTMKSYIALRYCQNHVMICQNRATMKLVHSTIQYYTLIRTLRYDFYHRTTILFLEASSTLCLKIMSRFINRITIFNIHHNTKFWVNTNISSLANQFLLTFDKNNQLVTIKTNFKWTNF